MKGDEKGENENCFIGRIFFNAICLHDAKEKHKEIQQPHLVCDDLSPLLISDPAVSITQTWQLNKEMFKETVFLCSAVGGKEVEEKISPAKQIASVL